MMLMHKKDAFMDIFDTRAIVNCPYVGGCCMHVPLSTDVSVFLLNQPINAYCV